MRARGAVLLGLAAICAACSGGDASTPLATVRDSAGVVIAESTGPAWGEGTRWRLDSVPTLTLAGSDSMYEFSQVRGATRLPDGRLVVADYQSHQVRWFGPDGAFLMAAGRDGEGPGDFSRLTSVSRFLGDSVLAFDYYLGRATIFDGQGRLGRILTLPPEPRFQELWPLDGDSLVGVSWSLDEFMAQEGPYVNPFHVLTVRSDGQILDSIAEIDGWNGYKVNRGDEGYRDSRALYVMQGQVAAGPHGIVMGFPDRMEFTRYDSRGVIDRIVRAPVLDEPLPEAEIAAQRASMITERTSAERRQLVERLPAPERRPAYSELLIDSEGYTWAARYFDPVRQADDPVRWYIFDQEGAWQGSMTTPARFTLFEVGPEYLLGTRRDDLDAEHVQLLRLDRTP